MRMRTLAALGGVVAAGFAAGYVRLLRPWSRGWGASETDTAIELPGDDLVPDATADTRAIEIGASPAALWPWLVQMSFDRGGFYSYDWLDKRGGSEDRVRPELQALAVDGVVPITGETAFVVRLLEPEQALVLYLDQEILERQLVAARAARKAGYRARRAPIGLRLGNAMLLALPGLMCTVAYVLEPGEAERTHLIVRARYAYETGGRFEALVARALRFGHFVMTRRQLLGIKERAEATGREDVTASAVAR